MNSQRARLLLQMTMAFLLAVLVPLSIFGTFAYLKTQNDYLERAEKQYQQQLDIICHRLNSDLEQVLQSRPVSYTHLDVYKRQVHRAAPTGRALGNRCLSPQG